MKSGLIVGVLLLGLSAWPLFLMAREEFIRLDLNHNYQFTRAPDGEATIGKTPVRLISEKKDARGDPQVRVNIGGHDYSAPSIYSSIVTVQDRQAAQNSVVVIQYLGGDGTLPFAKRKMHWRSLWVTADGQVRKDEFNYDDRCTPPIRSRLANFATPTSLGCKSDLMHGWPSLLYPILYPWISGALGAILIVVCGPTLLVRRKGIKACSA